MLSSGGTASAAHGGAPRLVDGAVGPGGRRGGRGADGARAGAATPSGLDMGGTSCDVSLIARRRAPRWAAGARSAAARWRCRWWTCTRSAPAAASIAWRDAGGALRVGPRSAGADPGPACYGRGGEEPTVTDANLLLGHLDGGLAAGRRRPARPRRRPSARSAGWPRSSACRVEETAAGIVRVASAEMAQAVRVVTVERGIDPRDLALVPFGGAGPLHAARSRTSSGCGACWCRSRRGVLSALGLVVAERRRDLVESVLLTGDDLTTRARSPRPSSGWPSRGRERARRRRRRRACAPPTTCATRARRSSCRSTASPRPDPARAAAGVRPRARATATATPTRTRDLELVTIRVAVALPGGAPSRGRRPRRGRTALFGGAMRGRRGEPTTGPRSSSCPAPRWSCRRAGARRAERRRWW